MISILAFLWLLDAIILCSFYNFIIVIALQIVYNCCYDIVSVHPLPTYFADRQTSEVCTTLACGLALRAEGNTVKTSEVLVRGVNNYMIF